MNKYFDHLNTPIALVDGNAIIKYTNPAFKRKVFLLDKPVKKFYELFQIGNPEQFLGFLEWGISNEKKEFEVRLQKDDSVFEYEISVTLIPNSFKYVIEFNEVSEFKRVRKDLIKKTTILQNLNEYLAGSNSLETSQNYMKRSLNFLLENLDLEKGYLHYETEIVPGNIRYNAEGIGLDKEIYCQLVNNYFFTKKESNLPTLVSKVLRNIPNLDPEFGNKYLIKKSFGKSSLYFVFDPGRSYGFEDSFDVNVLVSIIINRLIWTDLRIKDLKIYKNFIQ
jgi:hypothetical protein